MGLILELLARAPNQNAARAQFHLAPDLLVIAIVANLIPYKGHTDSLKHLVELPRKSDENGYFLSPAGMTEYA